MRVLILLSLIAGSMPAEQGVEALSHAEYEEIKTLKLLTKITSQLRMKEPKLADALSLTEDDVSFYVYTNNDRDGKHVLYNQSNQIDSVSSFDTNLDTVFVIHGWHNNYQSTMVTSIISNLLNVSDINAIAVDWDGIAAGLYVTAQSGVPEVGTYVAEFIQSISSTYGYSLDKISLIGHSLGAHIAGYAGQNTNSQLHAIVGLDAAAPLYFESDSAKRLSEDDAQYVLAIHTDALFLGVDYRIGTADFWPNGGLTQNGCVLDVTGSCSHSRSYQYYAESILNNNFIGTECSSYTDYTSGSCANNTKAAMGGPTIDTSISGNFYLKTNSASPFALGDVSS